MKKILHKHFLLVFANCLWLGFAQAQCTSCTYTATTSGGSFNLNGNETLCISANVSNLSINMNGSGNVICVEPGVTWVQDYLTMQGGCTVNVYGTLDNSQQSWSNIGVNGGTACAVNVLSGGTLSTATGGFGSNLTINNSGTLNFTNTGGIGNQGTFVLTNNAGGVVNAMSTTNFQIGNSVIVNNYGEMNLANAENAEGYLNLYNGSALKVSRSFNNHGAFIVEQTAQFELPCETLSGAAGATVCSFRVGDKGAGKEFINHSDCFEVNGDVNFEGATTNNGIIVLTGGNLSISKPSSGTGGHIVVQNGTSVIQNSGSYAGTNLTFCDQNTAGNDFDNVFNSPSNNLYTVSCAVTSSSCGGSPTCSMTVTSATPSACVPATNTYSLAVVLTYTNSPSGNINVTTSDGASISVAQTASPQTITLTGLTANGVQDIHVTAVFANEVTCTNTLTAAYDAPASCGSSPCPTPNCGTVTVTKN